MFYNKVDIILWGSNRTNLNDTNYRKGGMERIYLSLYKYFYLILLVIYITFK